MEMAEVNERTENDIDAACGNRIKYGKNVCARERGHIGPHRDTATSEAWSFRWFDDEGTPAAETDSNAQSEPLDAATSALYTAALRAERTAEDARNLAESLAVAAQEARTAYQRACLRADALRTQAA